MTLSQAATDPKGPSRVRALKAGVLYFAVVFGAGFVLGPIRVFYVEPRLGTRVAELLESPIMFFVSVIAARLIVRRLAVPRVVFQRLTMGGIALVLMLLAEFSFVSWIRGLSFRGYVATRDPVSGTVYYLLLFLFALMPEFVDRQSAYRADAVH